MDSVAGESGLGKSTLVNSLFDTTIYPQKENQPLTNETPKTVEIQAMSADLEENGVKLKLTCIDTPGFGDFVNNEDSWKPILENIESRFDAYLEQENRVNRRAMVDTRIHALIYFIAPTGHSLKPIDIEFMKRLCHRVNLIPVIAKSDTLTDTEIESFKTRILDDMRKHEITFYEPLSHQNDDPEIVEENKAVLAKLPFAVVGSDKLITVNGKSTRGRLYPWGSIDIMNEGHCDFTALRNMLIKSHMEELKDRTNHVLYENYRISRIGVKKENSGVPRSMSSTLLDQERNAHEQKMSKMEAEMKAVFQQKVAEKESKLNQSEDELYARHREMKEQLETRKRELEEKKRKLMAGKKSKGLFK